MYSLPDPDAVGTLLRHAIELLDGGVAESQAASGLTDYRPRYSPFVRTLVADGPLPVRDLAQRVGVTHSAASQTVAQMKRSGLVTQELGDDARQRIVHLTARARDLLPIIETEWASVDTAMRRLDAELPMPLAQLLTLTIEALYRKPFAQRIAEATTPPPP